MAGMLAQQLISVTASGKLRWSAEGEGSYFAHAGNTDFLLDKRSSQLLIMRRPGVGGEFVAQRHPIRPGSVYQRLLEVVEASLKVPSAEEIEAAAERDLLDL